LASDLDNWHALLAAPARRNLTDLKLMLCAKQYNSTDGQVGAYALDKLYSLRSGAKAKRCSVDIAAKPRFLPLQI
jgi:hypothetical protein